MLLGIEYPTEGYVQQLRNGELPLEFGSATGGCVEDCFRRMTQPQEELGRSRLLRQGLQGPKRLENRIVSCKRRLGDVQLQGPLSCVLCHLSIWCVDELSMKVSDSFQ